MRLLLVQILTVVLMTGLALVMTGSMLLGLAVRAGFAPEFEGRIALDDQHILAIHNGPPPTCAITPNPPQHDCFRPGEERGEFSVDDLTPHRVRSLVWFRLPQRGRSHIVL